MKAFATILLIMVFLLGVPLSSIAQESNTKIEIGESTIASLLMGLNSDNMGLKSSCAYMLGELRVSSAVVPLMRVLHNDENEEVRISAALALYKIGTPMSIHAVKQAIRFDDCKRVSKLANKFYSDFVREELKKKDKQETEKLFAQTED
ncbi:MAG: HEAT repeat domain-containing protein [Ignavibacterium sp.]|nr:MAG: HEAT repeat domain-containing protein [Ignavibacterium sp.]